MDQFDNDPVWVHELYRDVDAMDASRIGPWLADDYETQMANNPVVRGRDAALANSARFWATIRSMRHDIEEVIVDGPNAVSLAVVTYERLNGSTATMPVASYIRRCADRKIDRLKVYIDLSPLFGPT